MKVKDLKAYFAHYAPHQIDECELVVYATGGRGSFPSQGAGLPRVQSVGKGIDHDSGFLFIATDPPLKVKPPRKKPVKKSK